MRLFTLAVLVVCAVAAAYLPEQVRAQFSIPGAENAVSISLSPQYPPPQSTARLTLRSSLYDLDSSSVTWTVNGTEVARGDAVTSIDVKTGPLGSKTEVRADVTVADGTASAAMTVVPTSVDLLWESDSYIPPFYDGRALPSAGSRVRLVALTHFVRPGGGEVPADQIVFTWTRDSEVLGDLSGRGKSSITVDGPTLFGTETIVVEAASVDGSTAGQALLRIPDTEPRLTLYEDHPLFGVLYHQALGATTFVPKNEMSFIAIPYFASAASGDTGLQYEWQVNQSPVATNAAHSNEITVNAASSTGLMALINLSLTHASNYFLSVAGSWSVTFNKNGAGSFGGGDVFHQ